MARTDNLTNYLTDVASAIKEKKGDSTPISAKDFDTEIINLPGGGGEGQPLPIQVEDWIAFGSTVPDANKYGYWISSVGTQKKVLLQSKEYYSTPNAYKQLKDWKHLEFADFNMKAFANINKNSMNYQAYDNSFLNTYFNVIKSSGGNYYQTITADYVSSYSATKSIYKFTTNDIEANGDYYSLNGKLEDYNISLSTNAMTSVSDLSISKLISGYSTSSSYKSCITLNENGCVYSYHNKIIGKYNLDTGAKQNYMNLTTAFCNTSSKIPVGVITSEDETMCYLFYYDAGLKVALINEMVIMN